MVGVSSIDAASGISALWDERFVEVIEVVNVPHSIKDGSVWIIGVGSWD